MAKDRKKVKWPQPTSQHANPVVGYFKDDLKGVAEKLADHDRVDQVSKKHVNAAFAALALFGLQARRWWNRCDAWAAFGGLLFGIAFSAPGACASICGYFDVADSTSAKWSPLLMISLAITGGMIFLLAMYKGSLPIKRKRKTSNLVRFFRWLFRR